MPDEREQRIRTKAYQLWEAAGRPEGREWEHWAEAERLVDTEAATPGLSATPRKPRHKKATANAPAAEQFEPARKDDEPRKKRPTR